MGELVLEELKIFGLPLHGVVDAAAAGVIEENKFFDRAGRCKLSGGVGPEEIPAQGGEQDEWSCGEGRHVLPGDRRV